MTPIASSTGPNTADCELTVLMPCLNEAETLAICIEKAKAFLVRYNVSGEILVADNGSIDGSQEIAERHGAKVVHVKTAGYGAALLGGIDAARGKYVVMADADDSYDFAAIMPFLERLREDYDLVMGNRFRGGIALGAMPPLHRYLGNPVLSGIGRLFFGSPIGDFHCGMRGFNAESIRRLNLQTTGMEFASEMVVKATLHKLRIAEVPTTLKPDGRSRPPHLRSWHDGWRHLRFLLIFSPRWLFFYPGVVLAALGAAMMLWLIPGLRVVAGIGFDIHTMLYGAAALIIGMQAVWFALFSTQFAIGIKMFPDDRRTLGVLDELTLERGIVAGATLSLLGFAGSVYAVLKWGQGDFGPTTPTAMMRVVIPSLTMMIVGVQIVLGSFFMSVLRLSHK
jgi:glycosyltransferase involved in cell wall biosynthesis